MFIMANTTDLKGSWTAFFIILYCTLRSSYKVIKIVYIKN